MKEQFRSNDQPKKIMSIDFGVFSPNDMSKMSHLNLVNSQLFNSADRTPSKFGVLDKRMGVSDKSQECETCGNNMKDCPGHFGHVELELPVFHMGYLPFIVKILQSICKTCSRVMVPLEQREGYLKKFRDTNSDMLRKKEVIKKMYALCQKQTVCMYCNSYNGKVRKVAPWKIIHEPYTDKNPETDIFKTSLIEASQSSTEIKDILSRAQDNLNPLRCKQLLSNIPSEDCELLLMDPAKYRPEMYIFQSMVVPPVCIRPSVPSSIGGSNEDDLTMTMKEIIDTNGKIKQMLAKGHNLSTIIQEWDHLQYTTGMYLMGDITGLPKQQQTQKPIRALSTRLKGKTGRFRGNLLGKRAEFTARTVISPDPNLRIDEVAVPERVAKVLSFPERVTTHNRKRLMQAVINGIDVHPGANKIISKSGHRTFYLGASKDRRIEMANELEIGSVVERHVVDGDIVLFNRQPSLHRLSIMSHYARVMPWRTFRFNECVCGPYNADFDGDEMNLHVPQTEEARAEALTLMGTKNNLITPRNGEPVIAAIQDFITASYLLTRRDVFYDRSQFVQLCHFFNNGEEKIDLPHPMIIKPVCLWTGKQVFSVLLRPNKESNVLVNLKAQGKTKSKLPPGTRKFMCPRDGYTVIRNSEVLCGVMDKTLVGGNKASVFHILLRDFGVKVCADRMSRLARLCARFLGNRGFSIGVSDVIPGTRLRNGKEKLVSVGYEECTDFIKQYVDKKLPTLPGCSPLESLEAKLNGTLSAIRKDAGVVCFEELPRYNSPMLMALCGSKGSDINISQMIACVGQQTVNGGRIPNGFENRSLPHFPRHSKVPAAKGFVKNSFFTGLTPPEFFFHTMGGREGLVDTAVKTAETGYMQRRLIKALEDLCVMYDGSVRNSLGHVVQFKYGDDGLDPTDMEGKDEPCDLPRVFMHAKNVVLRKYPNDFQGLRPEIILQITESTLREKFSACSELFKQNVRTFLTGKANCIQAIIDRATSEKGTSKVVIMGRLRVLEQTKKITKAHLLEFLEICVKKYGKAKVQAGTAVGALAAQSIGEPGTQMTLKTFHFAGVASMNITLGVPRIKEIINASKKINTPIITATLSDPYSVKKARIVKGRLEVTYLSDVTKYIQEVIRPECCYITIKLDVDRIELLKLEVTCRTVCASLLSGASKLKLNDNDVVPYGKDIVRVYIPSREKAIFYRLQSLKRKLPGVLISGVPGITRAVINDLGSGTNGHKGYNLLVEGLDLLGVMGTRGVVGAETESNHIMEVAESQGIESARTTIIDQIQFTMSEHGMQIDTRHTMLLGDLMTCRGKVLGITRFGIGKMKDSVLMLASFERTSDILFDSSRHGMTDPIDGVSECIILGMPMNIGTGLFKLLKEHEPPTFKRRNLLFDTPSLHFG